MAEGERLEEGGIECGGDGIAPEGKNEFDARLDIMPCGYLVYFVRVVEQGK